MCAGAHGSCLLILLFYQFSRVRDSWDSSPFHDYWTRGDNTFVVSEDDIDATRDLQAGTELSGKKRSSIDSALLHWREPIHGRWWGGFYNSRSPKLPDGLIFAYFHRDRHHDLGGQDTFAGEVEWVIGRFEIKGHSQGPAVTFDLELEGTLWIFRGVLNDFRDEMSGTWGTPEAGGKFYLRRHPVENLDSRYLWEPRSDDDSEATNSCLGSDMETKENEFIDANTALRSKNKINWYWSLLAYTVRHQAQVRYLNVPYTVHRRAWRDAYTEILLRRKATSIKTLAKEEWLIFKEKIHPDDLRYWRLRASMMDEDDMLLLHG